jgi:hypothetical protein
VPEEVCRCYYITFTGAPNLCQRNNVRYVLRPETQTLAGGLRAVRADVYIIVAKGSVFVNVVRVFAEGDEAAMFFLRTCHIHMPVLCLLQDGNQFFQAIDFLECRYEMMSMCSDSRRLICFSLEDTKCPQKRTESR